MKNETLFDPPPPCPLPPLVPTSKKGKRRIQVQIIPQPLYTLYTEQPMSTMRFLMNGLNNACGWRFYPITSKTWLVSLPLFFFFFHLAGKGIPPNRESDGVSLKASQYFMEITINSWTVPPPTHLLGAKRMHSLILLFDSWCIVWWMWMFFDWFFMWGFGLWRGVIKVQTYFNFIFYLQCVHVLL